MKIKWNSEQIPNLNIKKNEGVTFLTYPAFEDVEWLVHGVSTRLGGVSQGIYSSMNLSFTRGDEESCVRENYNRIAAAMGFRAENIVTSDQTHTCNVRKVTEKDRGKGIVTPRDYTDIDGMITNVPGLVLATFYADCVPLYFVDPLHHAIGLSHSGWRGTVQKIGEVTIKKMAEEYGSNPKDMKVAIGPSICQDCYEVSEDVIEKFRENYDENLWPEIFYQKENGKYQLNLWKANESVFLESGILPEHIAVTNVCTHCNPDILFSHRTTGNERGTLSAFLALKK